MMGWDSGYGSSMMGGWGVGLLFMLLFGLLILIGVVLLIVLIVRSAGSHYPEGPVATGYVPTPHAGGPGVGSHAGGSYGPGGGYSFRDEATEIARKRLAEGQITPDEYNDIMSCLSRQS